MFKTVPSLRSPKYVPPPFASNTWINLFYFALKQRIQRCFCDMERETITLPDGGEISIDVAGGGLPESAPVIIVLHTLNGCGPSHYYFANYAKYRGWRCVVINRRGHAGMVLKTPSFNIMGEPKDTHYVTSIMKERYPNSFFAMAGISAGSGQLVTYLGKYSKASCVEGAVCLCPAYDISEAFKRMKRKYPALDAYLTKGLKNYFIKRNQQLLHQSTLRR